jgi:hypothetical protein
VRAMINKLSLFALLTISFSFASLAQKEGEIPETIIYKDDEAKLDLVPANRFFEQNLDDQPTHEIKPQEYDTKDYSINPPRFDAKVKIPTMPVDSLNPILPNYLKFGAGNYGTVLGEVYLTNKRSASYSYGTHLKHLSSSKGSLMNSGNGQDLAEFFGSKYGKVNTWNGHLSYSNNRYRYYGLPQTDSVNNKDSIKQTYQLFHGGINTIKANIGDKFTYSTGVDFYYLTTKLKAKELELLWNGKATMKLNDTRSASVDASISNANRTDSSSINRLLLMIKPTYKLIEENWDLTVGATINYSSDTLKGSKGLHLYPAIHANYNFIPGKVTLFAGAGGGMDKNTYRTFVQQNPYLGSNVPLSHTNRKIDLYVGSTGSIDNKVSYKVQMSYKAYTNQYFFTNSATDSSKFTALYDKAGLFSLEGGLFYDLNKDWRISANALYNGWHTDLLAKAWHQPAFQSSLGVQYNLKRKIYFNAEMYYLSGIQGLNLESNKTVKLADIADLSLKTEYRFSNSFSAFLELNNILSQKYQRYLYYQVKGFNVLAGLTYSF